jgi:hypothetical protein
MQPPLQPLGALHRLEDGAVQLAPLLRRMAAERCADRLQVRQTFLEVLNRTGRPR